MRDMGRSPNEILELGFYEFNALWFIFDELRARDLQNFAQALDNQQSKQEDRSKFYDWLRGRQPRRFTNGPRNADEQKALRVFMEEWSG